MLFKGGTLLIPSGTPHNRENRHLFVVCRDVDQTGRTVIVSVTSWQNNLCDATCILGAHDHPWLRHQSYVFYRKAEIAIAASLEGGLAAGRLRELDPMNGQSLLRIINGLCRSPQTSHKVKRYLGC